MKNSVFGDDQIPCKGRVIIQHLDYARRLLTSLRFEEEAQQNVAEEQARSLELAIIEIASLSCGAAHWDQLYYYLQEAGIEVSQEFCYRKMYLDRVMDDNPAEAKMS